MRLFPFHPKSARLLASFILVTTLVTLTGAASFAPSVSVTLPATTTAPPSPAAVASSSPTPLPTPTPFPSPTPSPEGSSETSSLPPLPTPPPSAESGAFLALRLAADTGRTAVSEAFDTLRRRGIRTLVCIAPDAHPDFLRLAIADGHAVGLYLQIEPPVTAHEVEEQVAAWEALSQRMIASASVPVALLPPHVRVSQEVEQTVGELGYHLSAPSSIADVIPGRVVQAELGPRTADHLDTLESALDVRGLSLLPHWLAATPDSYPSGERASTVEEFQSAHIVIVDPGHTRVDVGTGIPGADGTNRSERWANVQRAQAIREMLQEDGWTVALTHDDEALFDHYADAPDTDLSGATTRPDDTQFRANFVYYLGLRTGRRPVVVSLHVDSSASPDVWGPIFFYPPDGNEQLRQRSYRLALAMQDRVSAAWENLEVTAPSRGVRNGFRDGRKGRAGTGYDILGTSHIEPAPGAESPPGDHYVAVLVEAGTASHPAEGHILATVEGNRAMAQAHCEALNQWMRSELALLRLTQPPPCPDADSLSPAQIDWLAEQEVISGNTEERRVAFTFDAGSGADPWPTIRAACAEADVQLTMFLTGDFIRQYPEVVRQMVADGHDIQSHSDTHPNLTELDAPAVRSEFTGFQEALDEAVGAHVPVCLWRPPFGARSPAVRQVAAELGLLEIYWSPGGDTTGWREGATTERVINRVNGYLRPGQIFVMHINSWADAEALPLLLAQAEEEGYTVGDVWSVLTPEQIMSLGPPTVEPTHASSDWEPGNIP